ncbi:hypothetical protein [Streptococcus suis]|uniref:hypothetical protein n=3 Tax=Streptococcus suis TaxID=1307 RepID=UPI002412ACC7|nr:hypothetical protein [Streptococcus suis]MDG4521977.1 hypothetical protein [Streptococcus suis]
MFKRQKRGKTLYSMKIKSSLGNEAEDRTGVHQGKLTMDNFDFRRVLVIFYTTHSRFKTTKNQPWAADFLGDL